MPEIDLIVNVAEARLYIMNEDGDSVTVTKYSPIKTNPHEIPTGVFDLYLVVVTVPPEAESPAKYKYFGFP